MSKHNNITKDDEELTTLTAEVLEVTGESSLCIFCGDQSRKKRKRDTCDRYIAINKSKAPRGLKKWQKNLPSRGIGNVTINHITCSRCKSRTCTP